MNSTLRSLTVPLFLIVVSLPIALPAQPAAPVDETMMPADFTNLLKQVWSFLKIETETYLTSIASKGEFETAREFERRVADSRQQYLAKILKHSRDLKLDQQVFSVLFKASLGSYDPDRNLFNISSSTVIDAPYNIPTVQCGIRKNPYVFLADSIRSGYRTSSLYINLPKGNKWQVGRDLAKSTKADEENIFFRVKIKVDIEKPDLKDHAVLDLVPQELALMNKATNQVFWTVSIR